MSKDGYLLKYDTNITKSGLSQWRDWYWVVGTLQNIRKSSTAYLYFWQLN